MNVPRIRPATPADHPTFARLSVELGVDDPVPDAARFERDFLPGTWVATRGEVPVAYAFVQTLKGTGYIRHLVVDRAARRGGVGRFVMTEMAARFREAGCSEWCLNVKPGNAAARGLYESLGMRERNTMEVVRIAWTSVERLPRGALRVEPLAAIDEPSFEEVFGLLPGLLGAHTPSKTVLAVRDGAGEPLGVATFDAGFPGAFPFKARTIEAARALVDAFRSALVPIVDPEKPWREKGLQLCIEADPALVAKLVDAGGLVTLVTLHYRGPLGAA